MAPVGAIFLSNVRWICAGQILRNQFHWRLESNANNVTVDVVCDALQTEMAKVNGIFANMRDLADTACLMNATGQQMIFPDRYAGKGYIIDIGGNVSALGYTITQVCAVLTRRAVIATRRGVSKIHLPLAVHDTRTAEGLLAATATTIVGTIGSLITGTSNLGNGMTVRPVIYHRGFTPAFHYIESTNVQPQVRVMRRRTVGLGE